MACTNYALAALGLPTASHEAIARTVGYVPEDRLVMLAGEDKRPLAADFFRLYQERARQIEETLTFLYPPAPQVVRALKAQGLVLGIVSSGFRFRIEGALRRDGLLDAFDAILGFEDMAAHKPDPAGLLQVMERIGAKRESTLYVGDHTIDAETAQRAGVPFVAVLTGTTAREAFAGYPNVGILQDLADLPVLLQQ